MNLFFAAGADAIVTLIHANADITTIRLLDRAGKIGLTDIIIRDATDDDLLHGADGDNIINGLEGNDNLHGGTGRDSLNGGLGDDQLHGGGDTRLFADANNDGALSAGDLDIQLTGVQASDLHYSLVF